MLTVEQASEKWCPFTRVGERASGAAENRPDGSYNCITSGCMAWRWDVDHMSGPDERNGRRFTHGYCGLAG